MQTEVAAAVECMMEMTLAQGQSLRDTALAKMARQVDLLRNEAAIVGAVH